LDDLDMRLAYDDFGAGQARLIELVEVPPHVLKFDLSLTQQIDKAPAQRQHMLASLVHMVSDLGIQPLAEGMETASEAATCVQLGFELNQGFYYGQPMPVENLGW
jgi:EAL domain-containing protein (putative c-di-GMP-specific phosphodiesterase class I)